jgi:hypothetical protein
MTNLHLQLLEGKYLAQGMKPGEARCAARRAFGGVEQARERQRDARSFRAGDSYFPAGAISDLDYKLKLYHADAAGQVQPVTLAFRVRGSAPAAFAGRFREIAAAVAPDLQLRNILSLDESLRRDQWIRRREAAVLATVDAERRDTLVGGHLRTHVVHRFRSAGRKSGSARLWEPTHGASWRRSSRARLASLPSGLCWA